MSLLKYRYADVHPQWFKKTMNGILPQLKNKTLLKYKLQGKPKHVIVIIFKMSYIYILCNKKVVLDYSS